MARWDDEELRTEEPNDGIVCKNCKNRLTDVVVGEKVFHRYKYGRCDKYEYKPEDVLWKNAKCEGYEAEQ